MGEVPYVPDDAGTPPAETPAPPPEQPVDPTEPVGHGGEARQPMDPTEGVGHGGEARQPTDPTEPVGHGGQGQPTDPTQPVAEVRDGGRIDAGHEPRDASPADVGAAAPEQPVDPTMPGPPQPSAGSDGAPHVPPAEPSVDFTGDAEPVYGPVSFEEVDSLAESLADKIADRVERAESGAPSLTDWLGMSSMFKDAGPGLQDKLVNALEKFNEGVGKIKEARDAREVVEDGSPEALADHVAGVAWDLAKDIVKEVGSRATPSGAMELLVDLPILLGQAIASTSETGDQNFRMSTEFLPGLVNELARRCGSSYRLPSMNSDSAVAERGRDTAEGIWKTMSVGERAKLIRAAQARDHNVLVQLQVHLVDKSRGVLDVSSLKFF